MTTTKPSIVIVVQDGVIAEVAVTAPYETMYRIIDLDGVDESGEAYGDFYAETTGIDLKKFTEEKIGA